ncbi:hypothetical protein AQUCO_09900008v1 [Aquilegia coerulea]|uniref:Cytochrome P450 n=1 Tax=Aquilegia coerulea TaxID=218851 RepID=A0A2G5C5Q1_AQUCA|nr:hypothetical protein AQUCO_09900008v1 [Aquilegia coerulea]
MDSISTTISTLPTALAVLLVLITVTVVVRKLTDKKKYHPVGGTVFNQLLNFKRLHHYMTDLAGKHKTYRLLSPFRSEIYTSDPANVEYILKSNFPNYGKGWYNYVILKDLLGDGIFTVDGDKWKHQRKVSSYEFSTKVLRDFSSAVFRRNAERLASIISDAGNANKSVDIQDLFMKSTMDSIFKVGFGVELDSIYGSNEGTIFANAFNDSSALTLWRYVDLLWMVKKYLNVGFEATLRKNLEVIDSFIYKLIRTKIEKVSNSDDDSSVKKEDIMSRFLDLNETDPKYLRDIVLNFLNAGRDTTATTLSWFIYMLCKHPDIQEKIAQEVKDATQVKDNTSFSEFSANVTTEDVLDKMQYLHAALSETLRLYPAVPVDAKICFSDDTLPDGFSVKKGDMVSYQPYAMGRMKFIWGEDAEEFRPERWLDKDGTFHNESPFKFTAFQAGPRICLGKEFAYRQMKIYAALLLRCFMFKLEDEKKPVNYRTMLNLHIDGPLKVRAYHRIDLNKGVEA